MARQLRVEYEGAVYHIRSRGNAKQPIFLDDGDYINFLRLVGRAVHNYGWRCHSYCLIYNHYHLLIETPAANLSAGMHVLNGMYTQIFNLKYAKTGHVFEGRFRSKIIEDERYLLILARYIALNPVEAGLVSDPSEWKWSSYNAFCGNAPVDGFLATEEVLSFFEGVESSAAEAFRQFVLEGLLAEKSKPRRPFLAELISPGSSKQVRNAAIRLAHREYDYSGREIARYLGVNHTTIARILKSDCLKCTTGA